jgi:hypothetical protein
MLNLVIIIIIINYSCIICSCFTINIFRITTDREKNEYALHRVKEERNILHTITRRKANWIGHILRRNCFLKHVIKGKLEGRIEMTGRRGRRRKQLLDDRKETRGYWKLKQEVIDRTLWINGFARRYGPS